MLWPFVILTMEKTVQLELLSKLSGIPSKISVSQIVSYQLNYVSKDPPTHKGVYFDHSEQFGISFKTFKKIRGKFRVYQIVSFL